MACARDVLESITHGRKEQQSIDLYNSPLWTLKCDELAKLKIQMPGASAEPQNEDGPTEEAEPLAAGFAAGPSQLLGMIHFREAPHFLQVTNQAFRIRFVIPWTHATLGLEPFNKRQRRRAERAATYRNPIAKARLY